MSASRILAQAVNNLLAGLLGVKQPVLLHVRATIGASGVATVISTTTNGRIGTTAGVSIARVSAGVYDITFPGCRGVALGTLTGAAGSVSSGSFATADPRVVAYDKSTTNTNIPGAAGVGKIRVVFANGTAINTELADGSEINVSFWADLG